MSSYYQNGNGNDDRGRDRKLSGFTKRPREEAKGDALAEGGRGLKVRGTPSLTRRGNRLWVSLRAVRPYLGDARRSLYRENGEYSPRNGSLRPEEGSVYHHG